MIPFGVKIAWFILSATGFFACWIVLWAFGRAANAKWGPLIYGLGNSLLQGSFCLGMIYRMDPYDMPRSFCRAQTILISTGAFVITGVALAFSIATSMTVLKPKTWGDGVRALKWKKVYFVPTLGFPVVASIVHAVVVVKLDSAQPSPDMHCDSTAPEWVRLLGYAGLPQVIALPSLYLSIVTIHRINKTNKHIKRARTDGEQFTTIPRRSRVCDAVTFADSETSIAYAEPNPSLRREAVPSSGEIIATPTRKYRPPFGNVAPGDAQKQGNGIIGYQQEDSDSQTSFTFPTFANPDADAAGATAKVVVRNSKIIEVEKDKQATDEAVEWEDRSSIAHEVQESKQTDSVRWVEGKASGLASAGDDVSKDGYVLHFEEPYSPSLYLKAKTSRPIANLSPAVWQIILFQIAFSTVQLLAAVSTIVDLSKRRQVPIAFGSQHVALLLAAWGPVIVFGHLPSVKRNICFWRPPIYGL